MVRKPRHDQKEEFNILFSSFPVAFRKKKKNQEYDLTLMAIFLNFCSVQQHSSQYTLRVYLWIQNLGLDIWLVKRELESLLLAP